MWFNFNSESSICVINNTLIRFLDWFPNTRFGRKFLDIVYDTTVLVSYLGAFAVIHKVQEHWLGGDYVVFEKYKIKYKILAYAFYSTLQLLRFNLPGLKTEKKV